MEHTLSSLGAKAAQAAELCKNMRDLTQTSEQLLIDMQREIEELYISLGREAE